MTAGPARTVILTGFLGAGKTTLLNHLVSGRDDLSDTMIIVNDFGKLAIDADLIRQKGRDVIELISGCVCCTLAIDLKKTLLEQIEKFQPKWILLEASGIGDPRSIARVFADPAIEALTRLYLTAAVLDADLWLARDVMGQLFYLQLEAAGLILLNKVDRVDQEKVPKILEDVSKDYPGARVVPCAFGRVEAGLIFSPPEKPSAGLAWMGRDSERTAHQDYITFSFEEVRPLNEKALEKFLAGLPFSAFRIKGPVRFKDQTRLLNYTGGKIDWSDWKGPDQTGLVVIGWGLDTDSILAGLRKCID